VQNREDAPPHFLPLSYTHEILDESVHCCSVPRSGVKRGFHPTQRTQRKERNEMTSLLDRPIIAASDDGVCRRHAAKLWQTRHKI